MFGLLVTNGLFDDPKAAIRTTLNSVRAVMAELAIKEPFRATFAVSNGEQIWAVRWSSDVYAPSLYQRDLNGDILLASEPLDGEVQNWQEIPPNSLVCLQRNTSAKTSIEIEELFDEAPHVRAV